MFEQLPESQEQSLKIIEAKFPQVANKIRMAWGTEEGKAYLDSLMIDDRGGRAGFSFDVIMALMELQSSYKATHVPKKAFLKDDPWKDFK